MIQNKQAIYLLTLAHYKETLVKQNKNYSHIGNCEEEELPKKPVGRLSANRQPTAGQQTADSQLSANRFFGELFFTITKENNLTLQVAKKFNFTMLFSKIQ